MIPYNVLIEDFNTQEFISYNIMPYLIDEYNNADIKPKTTKEFTKFVEDKSKYQYWSRCEYELIITDWPKQRHSKKVDVYDQIMLNLDIVVRTLIGNVYANNRETKTNN